MRALHGMLAEIVEANGKNEPSTLGEKISKGHIIFHS